MNMLTQPSQAPASVPALAESEPQFMKSVFDRQLETALRWRTSTARERIARIKKLRDAMMAQRDAFYEAFMQDYRKSPSEVEASELLPVMDEARHAIGRLRRWMKPRRVWPTSTMLGTSASVHYQPRGRVLIIAPWNYPLSLCFGPLVSVLGFSQLDTVIAEVNARPKPLALYVWSRDRHEIDKVLTRTSSGGACVNHCVMHFAHGELPFGGVNNSGIGSAHGHYGFIAFSHERAVLRSTPLMLVKLFFPPFTKMRQRIIRSVVDMLRLPML